MIKIVGHRGSPAHAPENTLLALEAAIKQGADAIECDVQLNKENQAYILHDPDLKRVAGDERKLSELSCSEVSKVSVHEAQRFSQQFYFSNLPHLKELVSILEKHPKVLAFIEIKKECFIKQNKEWVYNTVTQYFGALKHQVVFISFDFDFINIVKQKSEFACAWVLRSYDEESRLKALQLQADYLICNYKKLDKKPLWSGTWQWFVYDIDNAQLALSLLKQGAKWIETRDVQGLKDELKHEA